MTRRYDELKPGDLFSLHGDSEPWVKSTLQNRSDNGHMAVRLSDGLAVFMSDEAICERKFIDDLD